MQTPAEQRPASRKPVDTGRPRPDSSFKIKDTLRQVNQAQPVVKIHQTVVEEKVKTEVREPIDEPKVKAALEKYITEHRPDPTITIALKAHRPLVEEEKIVIHVDNQLQLEKLEALKMHLLNALIKMLRNGFLALEFKLFDTQTTTEEKKLYTASEKFEHFLKLNPVVADLKQVFGLELE